MSNAIETAKQYISDNNYQDALKLARKRHGKDAVEEYLAILDLLINADYLLALEEKGLYYQYYDESHDDGDYGEKYFDQYLKIQPNSVNVLCDKALSRFNKGYVEESLGYMDEALNKYDSYVSIEEPRITKSEVLMSKIKLLINAKMYDDALTQLNQYEKEYGEEF